MDKKDEYSTHDYKARFLPSVWSVFVVGEFETVTSLGSDVSVTFDGDLGYDDPYPTFQGEASFRRGRHDFWITGMVFDQSESAPANVEFTINDNIFNIGGVVDSEATITDINFTYGYSFFEFEEDGFRLGPTVAVSYTDISLEVTELTIPIPTGARFSYEDTFPIPTIGEEADLVVWAPSDASFGPQAGRLPVAGVEIEGAKLGRKQEVAVGDFGVDAGLKAIYADLDLGDEKIDDLLLWEPAVGLEFRF